MGPEPHSHVHRGRTGAPGLADSCQSPGDSLQTSPPHPTPELAMPPICVGACRTHNSPEVVTWPQKCGKANCRLKQEGTG